MADIPSLFAVDVKSFQSMVFDAGMLFDGLDYASATDAQSLAEIIKTAKEQRTKMLGATKGGINIQCAFTFWNPEPDGYRMSFKGDKRLDKADVKISGTAVEFTPDNVKRTIALADVTGEGGKIGVKPRFSIKLGDYTDHLIWVGNLGSEGIVLVDLKNALCTNGLNTQTTDKDIGTLPFEYVGHADDVLSTELPVGIWFFGKAT